MRLVALLLLLTAAAPAAAPVAPPIVLDDFEDVTGWKAWPADGVSLTVGSDAGVSGRSLRLDVDFHGGGGYAVAHKALAIDLPSNYAFTFRVRGELPPNHLEFKLLDASGENVWWFVHRDVVFDGTWTTFTIKKRQIAFAWGPGGGGELDHVAAVEFAITAGSGGKGTVWIDDFTLVPRREPGATPPPIRVTASSGSPGHDTGAVLDGDPETAWIPAAGDDAPALVFDFREPREFGGMVLDWLPSRGAGDYAVEAEDGEGRWRTLRTVRGSNGGRDYLYLPDGEATVVRLRIERWAGREPPALAAATAEPVAFSATRQAFFERIAADAPRGSYPRGMSGEQALWTVVGADCDPADVLVSEDGAVEVGRGGFSIEPFLLEGGRLATWADVKIERSLPSGPVPMPSVTMEPPEIGLDLAVDAFTVGEPGASSLVVRYRVKKLNTLHLASKFALAIRPFQVNPPSQFLNVPGGPAIVRSITFRGGTAVVNDTTLLRVFPPPIAAGAATFDGGDIVADHLRAGGVPASQEVRDAFGAASGAMLFDVDSRGPGVFEILLMVPLHPGAPGSDPAWSPEPGWSYANFRKAETRWHDAVRGPVIRLPAAAGPLMDAVRAEMGYVLVNRAGPAIQPGTRAYARSWIRDGALTSSAMLRLGRADVARDFLLWYAPHQYASGKAPCVVDWRGADPVPEHDSTGEFLFLIAETYRYTHDRALLESLYPRVRLGVAYLDSLRRERRTPEYETVEKREFYGLLPESISHEGYSAKPMHSYWDDFWAVRGFRDAVYMARELGRADDAGAFDAIRGEFERDLAASIAAAMRKHDIGYVPGCADLGDFDATSTTIALEPADAAALAPPGAIERTFDRYDAFFAGREAGDPWEAFTPYEIRNIGAFVRLGRRDRAQDLVRFFLDHRLPPEWNQWPEVVWHDARTPHFLGDLPHTWVGSDFIRSVLDMILYVDRDRGRLVLGAGIPAAWLDSGSVTAEDLPSPWGPVSYTMRRENGAILLTIDTGLSVPPGGILVRPPLDRPARRIVVNGRSVEPAVDVLIRVRHAIVRIEPQGSGAETLPP